MSFRCFSLSARACFWNALFNDLTLSLSPTLFASFLSSAILMAYFESHGVVLPFFFFGMCFSAKGQENIPEPIKLVEGGYDQMLTELHITEEMVVESLGNLREDKTLGIDEIHPKFLKEVGHEVGAILSNTDNESIRDWRDAIVTPLF